jgi:CRP-like cAMP-binding protein
MTKRPEKKEVLDILRNALTAMADIPESEWVYVSRQISRRSFKKGEFLLRAGDFVENFFFIVEGLVRFYYLSPAGKESNKYFAAEKQFVGSISALHSEQPCPFTVEALERTYALVLPAKMMREGYKRHPAWERIGRCQAERVAAQKVLRESEFLMDTAETRYCRFLSRHPDLVGRIPQYHIASYLGITGVALSRIRKKMRERVVVKTG